MLPIGKQSAARVSGLSLLLLCNQEQPYRVVYYTFRRSDMPAAQARYVLAPLGRRTSLSPEVAKRRFGSELH